QKDELGRSCTSCHLVHGSDLPRHVADSVLFLGSNWRMKIGLELTKDGGSCSPGCHEPLSYSRRTGEGVNTVESEGEGR
ncbi:MAG: hypothetical protein V2A76_12400, partial [Planctomycetota bacterium]